jgi:hypothetical protein
MLTVFDMDFIVFTNFFVLQAFTLQSECLDNDSSKIDDC